MGVLFTHVLVEEEDELDRLLHAMADHERELNLAGWQRRLADDPDNAEFRRNVALQLRLQNRHREAIETLREALRVDPDHAATHNDLGLLLVLVERDYAEAARHLREAVRLDPGSASGHRHLASAYLGQGEQDWRSSTCRRPCG